MASTWAKGEGGFLDFRSYEYYASHGVYTYWSAGTGMSCVLLFIGLCYIINEYCTQSHLSTDDYGRAMHGLKITRRYKRYTMFFRGVPNRIIKGAKYVTSLLYKEATRREGAGGKRLRARGERRGLVWTVTHKQHVSTDVLEMAGVP